MPHSILILTDHSRHTSDNSMYDLAKALLKNKNCSSVDVASRGMPGNHDFFIEKKSKEFQVVNVGSAFKFESGPTAFTTKLQASHIDNYDFILLRLPHPIDPSFLNYLTSIFPEKNIVNRPSGIIDVSSKAFLMEVQELCPPMRIVENEAEVQAFAKEFPIVLKPFFGYGGAGIVKTDGKSVWMGNREVDFNHWAEVWRLHPEPYLAMEYLPGVKHGDKRVLVVNGKIMGASLRIPPDGSWMCNVSLGGHSVYADVEPEEKEMAKILIEKLAKRGICIFGFDTLIGKEGKRVLSEVNVLSIGGIVPMEKESGRPVVQMTADGIVDWMLGAGY
ncbi:MAG: glutathione synthetase [Saprospiraceae bacterium]